MIGPAPEAGGGAPHRRGLAYRRRIGGAMLAACGALASLGAALPGLDHSMLLLAFSLVAVVMGAALVARPELAPPWTSQVLIGLVTVLISVGVAAGGEPGSPVDDLEVFYVLVAVYAFYFFSGWSGLGQVAFAGLAYAAVLWGQGGTATGVARWATTLAGMVVAGIMVRAMNREVDDLVLEMDANAARDPLTGILNRRGLEERLGIELTRARRTGEPLCVIAADLDGLKQINDRHGHAAGDEALSLAADVMGSELRDVDVLARTGGDEFLVLLPNCDLDSGAAIAENLRVRVAAAAERESWPATMSLGVATAPPLPLDPDGFDKRLRRGAVQGQGAWARPGRPRRAQRAAAGAPVRLTQRPGAFGFHRPRPGNLPSEERRRTMYKQVFDPVGDSLGLSAIFAVLPLVTLFVLLGGVKLKAQWAALSALAVGAVVAIAVYGMPVGQTVLSATEGATFGLFPIMWIVVTAIWVYNMTVVTSHFAVLRRSFGAISDDQRIQAVIIAFCFGALLEALAGFGTPVAITAVMLIALGFNPIKAASVALVANTAPVAFGAIAIPITTLGEITGLPPADLGAMVGRQTPLLAVLVPLVLVFMVDGGRGLRQTWPAAAVGGLVFAVAQYGCSNFISIELTDIVASLASTGALVAFLRVWQPGEPLVGEPAGGARPAVAGSEAHDPAMESEIERRDRTSDPRGDVAKAYAPYAIIIAVFSLAQLGPIKDALAKEPFTHVVNWPGLHVTDPKGEALSSLEFNLNWLPAAGTLMLISGVITAIVLGVGPGRAARVAGGALDQLKWAILTVASVLALAYVMNQSGQTITLGLWVAGAGSIFALLSGAVGWLGVAVTGSDTSSNALFGALQVQAAKDAGLSPTLLAAANSSGGVLGKMISPQNLAIGAAAVGMAGQEGDLFRKVVGWSVVLLVAMCMIIYLQSTAVLDWMVVK